jgi:uncharacterized membrane protein
MFKLGYQAFIIMSIVSGYTIVNVLSKIGKDWFRRLYLLGLIPLVLLVMIYPYFAVKSYFGDLKIYDGLDGLSWLQKAYPDDYAAIGWFNKNVKGQPVILEAAGDSYTDYNRISAFTGLPTVAGWAVHEWLWRGGYDPIAKRAAEVEVVYVSDDIFKTKEIIEKYGVRYIIIGDMERTKYLSLNEEKIRTIAIPIFIQGNLKIYRVN